MCVYVCVRDKRTIFAISGQQARPLTSPHALWLDELSFGTFGKPFPAHKSYMCVCAWGYYLQLFSDLSGVLLAGWLVPFRAPYKPNDAMRPPPFLRTCTTFPVGGHFLLRTLRRRGLRPVKQSQSETHTKCHFQLRFTSQSCGR